MLLCLPGSQTKAQTTVTHSQGHLPLGMRDRHLFMRAQALLVDLLPVGLSQSSLKPIKVLVSAYIYGQGDGSSSIANEHLKLEYGVLRVSRCCLPMPSLSLGCLNPSYWVASL